MSANYYVEKVLSIKLNEFQKELLRLLETSPKGYLRDVYRKHHCAAVKQVAHVFERYEHYIAIEG